MRYKHIVIPTVGGPENLNLVEDELPEPRANEVRIKVLAAGVSFADILMRKGVHPESWNLARTPFTPGWDVVGIVDKLGDGVSKWQTGQMVAALPIVGGYAEYIILQSNEPVPVPSRLDHAEAVSLILNYTTAYQMLHRCAHIKPGEVILINGGAAGGVGTALLQLGKIANLKRMYGTVSYEKHDIVFGLGGTPIDYKSVDLVQEITKATRYDDGDNTESGVDAVFDGIGGKSLKSSYEMLRGGGRLVAYGGTPTADLGDWLMMFTLNLVPDKREFMLYSIQTLKRLKPDWFHEDLISLLNLLEQGKLKPIVAAKMPLNQAAQAHELLASGSVTGKIVLICND
ncbi:MAG TPA: medium chain dehydrogenase/reductase family protein [Nitrososphaeraceae archaeon]|nr:medium chain dehydrogenase/reductase family protein [Nitrososphaeraceae archaeon]